MGIEWVPKRRRFNPFLPRAAFWNVRVGRVPQDRPIERAVLTRGGKHDAQVGSVSSASRPATEPSGPPVQFRSSQSSTLIIHIKYAPDRVDELDNPQIRRVFLTQEISEHCGASDRRCQSFRKAQARCCVIFCSTTMGSRKRLGSGATRKPFHSSQISAEATGRSGFAWKPPGWSLSFCMRRSSPA